MKLDQNFKNNNNFFWKKLQKVVDIIRLNVYYNICKVNEERKEF